METEKTGLLKICRWNIFDTLRQSIDAGVTTRHDGFSKGLYYSLNLGLHVEDDPEAVIKNRTKLCRDRNWDLSCFTCGEQVHGCRTAVISKRNMGNVQPATDALITGERGIPLAVFLADCVGVVLYDKRNHCAGVCHAGWRGTHQLIVIKTIEEMSRTFGTNPSDIIAGISPSIGPCCFTIGEETETFFKESYPYPEQLFITDGRKCRFDLWEANKFQMTETGVQPKNIESAGLCTFCGPDDFYSYRRSGGRTGRFAAFAHLI